MPSSQNPSNNSRNVWSFREFCLFLQPNQLDHFLRMRLIRLAITIMMLVSTVTVSADKSEEIRKNMTHQKGLKLLDSYQSLYLLSRDSSDLSYQLKCLDDLIREARRQGNTKVEDDSWVEKLIFFYNNELDDSLRNAFQPTLALLKDHNSWKNYYEVWTMQVNLYNFSGDTSMGLKEVNEMYHDAKSRQNRFGMGMAYYAMGNVYSNMYNPDEALSSYQKSVDILMELDTLPIHLSDVFSYYAEELVKVRDFLTMERLTAQWEKFLNTYYEPDADNVKKGEMANRWRYYYLACAQAALGLDKLDQAEEMLNKVKEGGVEDEVYIQRMWLYYQARLYQKQGRYQEALKLNDQSLLLMMSSDDQSIQIQTRQQRAEILEQLGRYQEAARLYHEMYNLSDSINTHDIKRQLTEMNARFHVGELELEKQRAQYRNTLIIVSIIIVALVLFILFRYIAAQRLKVAHQKLEEAHGQLLAAYDQLEETTTAKERIESELRIARNIQMGMVPRVFPPFPDRQDIDLYASITPAKAVGGDLYDFFILDGKLFFCLGDVSGKGVPASLFMAVAVNLFRVAARQHPSPAEIATRMNDVLAEDNENSMFVTMFIGVADLSTGRLEFCNAGHNPPVVKEADGTARFLKMKPNSPLGFWPGLQYVGESLEDISMRPIFVYSDGLNEAENAHHDQFGDDRLLSLIQEHDYESAEQTINLLLDEVHEHVGGAEQSDDLTMLCLRIHGNKC